MKIIEFVGLPGSGKTTLCNILEHKLRVNGFKVINLQRMLPGNTFSEKIYRKIIHFKANYSIENRYLRKLLKMKTIQVPADNKEWIQKILLTNYRIHNEAKAYDYVLLDEGFLQFTTSLYHGVEMKDKEVVMRLFDSLCEEYRNYPIVFYLQSDLEESYKRIRDRNRLGDRFLVGNSEDIKELLAQKEKNLDFVMRYCGLEIHFLDNRTSSTTLLVEEVDHYI